MHMSTTTLVVVSVAMICSPLGARSAFAQEDPVKEESVEVAPAEEAEAGDTMEERPGTLEQDTQDDIEDLQEQIDELEEMLETSKFKSSPAQSLNVFNPRTTVFGNFLGRLDNKTVSTEEGAPIDNRFNLREVELDYRAAIDPWADGTVIATFEAEVPGEYSVAIEEGYVTLKKLPILDIAPWGLKLKIGRFRPELGRFNKIHTHDLPQTNRPLVLQTFLGEEGFITEGAEALFFVPTPGQSNVLEVSLAAVNGGGLPIGADNIGEDPGFIGHLKWFWDLADGHNIEVGASSYVGKFDVAGQQDARLYGLDFQYKWKPFEAGEWRSFLLGGSVFRADVEQAASSNSRPIGFYAWSQYQFSRSLYLGARYDFAEVLLDADLRSQAVSGYLTYYTTEFLRFRLGAEHKSSDIDALDNLNSALLEINFIFGSHPVEPYWVNK